MKWKDFETANLNDGNTPKALFYFQVSRYIDANYEISGWTQKSVLAVVLSAHQSRFLA